MVNRKLFRPALPDVKEQYSPRQPQPGPAAGRPARSLRRRNRPTRKVFIT